MIEEKRRKKEGEGFWKDLEEELERPEVTVEGGEKLGVERKVKGEEENGGKEKGGGGS